MTQKEREAVLTALDTLHGLTLMLAESVVAAQRAPMVSEPTPLAVRRSPGRPRKVAAR